MYYRVVVFQTGTKHRQFCAGKFEKELHVKQAIISKNIDYLMDENPMDSNYLEATEIEARILRL